MDSNFHKDMLVDILLRLPPSARRRARLVCRLWRDAVDKRRTEMQSRGKALLWNARSAVAYVVDDLSTARCRELWRNPHPRLRDARHEDVDAYADDDLQLVGSCNGLLCLCENSGGWAGGTVTLVNPATGATLPVPPLPRGEVVGSGYWQQGRWDKAYSLAYHPTTGRYKLVHAPTFPWTVSWGIEAIYAVHVLTLEEEASWREVAPSCDARTRCRLDAGVVSVDGATYWVTGGGAPRVVSFDLDDERVRCLSMPSMIGRLRIKDYSLTVVRGRLEVVAHVGSGTTVRVRAERRWSHQYTLTSKYIPRPYFAYGDHILKAKGPSLYVHRRKPVPSSGGKLACAVIEVGHRDQDQGMMITNMKGAASHYRAFAHVETAEPLDVYTGKYPPPPITEDVFI